MERGTALAGCSAGACFVGELAPDSTATRLEDITWRHGLGLVRDTTFGPHWDMLESYLPGLQGFILQNVPEGQLFIGLDERTAMAGDGEDWQVFGNAGVHVRKGDEWIEYRAGDTFTMSELRG